MGSDVGEFVRANLPQPPARVLEIGAGAGKLARALRDAGYSVIAIDPEPAGEGVLPVPLADLDEPKASFDAAFAVLALHHVNPLEESCAHLARLLRRGAPLVLDEFDVERFDERAAAWWLEQRRTLGFPDERTPGQVVADLRANVHPLAAISAALATEFDLSRPRRGSYLYRWDLDEALRRREDTLIDAGMLPAVGVRLVAARKADYPVRRPTAS